MTVVATTNSSNVLSDVNSQLCEPAVISVDYDLIDEQIISSIDALTQSDSKIWDNPDGKNYQFAHGLFQYPAMMVPIIQKNIINIIKNAAPGIDSMLDPFMGSSTSLIAGMQLGLNCFGQDVNPLAVLLSTVKTNPRASSDFQASKSELLKKIDEDLSEDWECLPFNLEKWFKPSVAISLSKVARAIKSENDLSKRQFYWIVFSETVRLTSNDRTSTFKLHLKDIEKLNEWNPCVISVFKEQLEISLKKYNQLYLFLEKSGFLNEEKRYSFTTSVSLGDSSTKITLLGRERVPLLVTSPPYGDNRTTVPYGQHSYLPLQWIQSTDIGIDNDFLTKLSMYSIDNMSLGGTLKNKPYNEYLRVLTLASPTFRNDYENAFVNLKPPLKNKIIVFLFDLFKSISTVQGVLGVNGYSVWTIGNRNVGGQNVRNSDYLIDFMTYLGSRHVTGIKREILNKRMPRKNDRAILMNFEDIIIFRKLND